MSIWTKWQKIFNRIKELENRISKLEQAEKSTEPSHCPCGESNCNQPTEFSGYITENPNSEPCDCEHEWKSVLDSDEFVIRYDCSKCGKSKPSDSPCEHEFSGLERDRDSKRHCKKCREWFDIKPSDSGGEKEGVTVADVIITHENTKWYRGECCSGYPNCIHKPLLASQPKSNELVPFKESIPNELGPEQGFTIEYQMGFNHCRNELLALAPLGQPKARVMSAEDIWCILCTECGNKERGDLLNSKKKEQELWRYAKAIHNELIKENEK